MRVCIVVTNSLRKDPRVQKAVRMACESGLSVFFIGVEDANYKKDFFSQASYEYKIIKYPRYFFIEGLPAIIKVIREIHRLFIISLAIYKTKAEVVHANDFDTLPPAWLSSLFSGSRIVYDSHEIFSENHQLLNKSFAKRLIKLVEGFIIRRVSKVVSVSNAASLKLAEIYGIPRPIVVTNCPYKSTLDMDANKSKYFEVLYHGQFYKGRGYEEFIRSAAYLPEGITLVLRGYGEQESELRQIVADSGLRDRVIFSPPVEIDQLIPSAAQSHVGVVLTKPVCMNFEYTVSNKLFEYLAAGLPVILSDVPEHRYLVEKYNFGLLVESVEPQSIGMAIRKLAENIELYQKMRANAIAASQVLCWEIEGKKLIDCYKVG